MSESALDRLIGSIQQQQVQTEQQNRDMAHERAQWQAWLTGSINSVSVDLANRLLAKGIAPSPVTFNARIKDAYEYKLTQLKKVHVTENGTYLAGTGWLINYCAPTTSGWVSNEDGYCFFLDSAGCPVKMDIHAGTKTVRDRIEGAGAFTQIYLQAAENDLSSIDRESRTYGEISQNAFTKYCEAITPLVSKLA
jgi:hypothetical protein